MQINVTLIIKNCAELSQNQVVQPFQLTKRVEIYICFSKALTLRCIYVFLRTCRYICVYNVCMCSLTEWQEHGRISPASQVPKCVFSEE